MLKTRTYIMFSLLLGFSAVLVAQTAPSSPLSGPCPTANSQKQVIGFTSDLICTVPQVYGPEGLRGPTNLNPGQIGVGPLSPTGHEAHFLNSSAGALAPLNEAIGIQISQLPLTAPATGFIFSFNPSLGVVSRETQNFGPILSDRAETLGRHAVFVGLSYQYFNYDKIDGINLRHFGAVFQHGSIPSKFSCPGDPSLTGCTPSGSGQPIFLADFIATTNGVGLIIHQVTAVATFGLTNRLDLSVAVPVLSVHMRATSDATINSYESALTNPNTPEHTFDSKFIQPGEQMFSPAHAFFSRSNSAVGIGDVIVRAKFQAIRREKAGLAAGVDVHAPTGNEKNFLGAGTWGTRPFLTFSYAGRVAPHANIGYQINGNSILAGDVTGSVTKTYPSIPMNPHLPNILNYSVGLDGGINRRVSASLDFIDQLLFHEQTISAVQFTSSTPSGCNNLCSAVSPSAPDIHSARKNVNVASIALGGKVNPFGRLLVTANVLFRVNEAGLHFKPAPLVGLSYTF